MGLFSKDSFKIENGICRVKFATKGVLDRKAVCKILEKPKVRDCGAVEVVVGKEITAVGEYAFGGFHNLTGVTIEEGAVSIGQYAFSRCKSLKGVAIPKTVKEIGSGAFNGCESLTSIALPEGIECVNYNMFEDCVSLNEVALPNTVKKIYESSFFRCEALTKIVLPNGVTLIDAGAFKDCYSLAEIKMSEALEEIGGLAFSGCANLKKVQLPENLLRIGEKAFYHCYGMDVINVPKSVNEIGNEAFAGCSQLKINCCAEYQPDTWTDGWNADNCYVVWDYAPHGKTLNETQEVEIRIDSYGCEIVFNVEGELTRERVGEVFELEKVRRCKAISVSVSEAVTEIGDEAFSYLARIDRIYLSDGLKRIGERAFLDCVGLSEITIPDSVTDICANSFEGCNALKFNKFSGGLYLESNDNPYFALIRFEDEFIGEGKIDGDTKIIASNAFANTRGLMEIIIPDGVSVICKNAFGECKSLKTAVIPESVVIVGREAFADSFGMTVYCASESKPEGWDEAWTLSEFIAWNYDEALLEENRKYGDPIAFINGSPVIRICGSGALSGSRLEKSLESNRLKEYEGYSLILENGITEICDGAFAFCRGLASIKIPKSVKKIGKTSFELCSELSQISVDGDNEAYCSIDGNLYSRDGRKLIKYAIGKRSTVFSINDGTESIGELAFDGCDALVQAEIPASVKKIGRGAFRGCKSLQTAIIPEAVEKIGDFAFAYCDELNSIKIPEGVVEIGEYAFCNCSLIDHVELPETIEVIGDGAFACCYKLNSINLPEGLREIGAGAFGTCLELSSVIIPEAVEKIGKAAFDSPLLEISCRAACKPDGWDEHWSSVNKNPVWGYRVRNVVEYMDGENRYQVEDGHCTVFISHKGELTKKTVDEILGHQAILASDTISVRFGDDVTKIGKNAFEKCKKLIDVEFSDNLREIEFYSFAYCNGLKRLTLGGGLTKVSSYAFSRCDGVTSIEIEAKCPELDDDAFTEFTNLVTVTASPDNKYYKSIDGVLYSKDGSALICHPMCRPEREFRIPDSVTTIKRVAFYINRILKRVEIPENVSVIDDGAFSSMLELERIDVHPRNKFFKSVDGNLYSGDGKVFIRYSSAKNDPTYALEYGVETIARSAFNESRSLLSVVIPDSVTVIGDHAFSDCHKLSSVTIPRGVRKIGTYAFMFCTPLRNIIIPRSVSELGRHAFLGCDNLTVYCEIGEEPLTWEKDWESGSDVVWGYGQGAVSDEPKDISASVEGDNCVIHFNMDGELTREAVSRAFRNSKLGEYKSFVVKIGERVTGIEGHAMSTRNGIRKIEILSAMTEIGKYAFSSCCDLECIEIPETVTRICENAFSHCVKLAKVTIPNSVTVIESSAFAYCEGLTTVEIPNSVTEIGFAAFEMCKSLKSAVVHGADVNLDISVFENCESLESITLPRNIKIIPGHAFKGCRSLKAIQIPDSVTKIDSQAFKDCTGLERVVVKRNVKAIESGAFDGCDGLTLCCEVRNEPSGYRLYGGSYTVVWGYRDPKEYREISVEPNGEECVLCFDVEGALTAEKVKEALALEGVEKSDRIVVRIRGLTEKIEDMAFYEIEKLVRLEMEDGVEKIGDHAFRKCSRLESVKLPESLYEIGKCAFFECKALTNITLPGSIFGVGDFAFSSCTGLQSVSMLGEYMIIGRYMFENCKSLAAVNLPKEFRGGIGGFAFRSCEGLTRIELPEGTENIGEFAFGECKSLVDINIPENLSYIGMNAFEDCESLPRIYIPSGTQEIDVDAFRGCSSLVAIEVDEDNENYKSIDGNLYSKDGSVLVAYAAGKPNVHFDVPYGVMRIGANAFCCCERFESVTLPDTLTHIEEGAFYECKGLKSIRIPNEVGCIESEVFCACAEGLTICCEAATKPEDWDDDWVADNATVLWGQ